MSNFLLNYFEVGIFANVCSRCRGSITVIFNIFINAKNTVIISIKVILIKYSKFQTIDINMGFDAKVCSRCRGVSLLFLKLLY